MPLSRRTPQVLEGARLRQWALTVLVLLLVGLAVRALHAQSSRPAMASTKPPGIDDVLWWLPPDTESLIVANGPFPFPPAEEKQDDRIEQAAERNDMIPLSLLQPQLRKVPLVLFWGIPNEIRPDLDGLPIVLVVEGSRRVRVPPPGDDVMIFQGCSVAVFNTDVRSMWEDLKGDLRSAGAKVEGVGSTATASLESRYESSFLAQPAPNVLVACNNREYLAELLERVGKQERPRALPDHLPEWRYVSRNALFWGLRHYDRAWANTDDPTSPFNKNSGAYDPQAIGFAFSYAGGETRAATTTSLTGDLTAVRRDIKKPRIVVEPERGVKVLLRRRSPAPGVLETIWTLDRYNTASYYMLEPMSRLGHGIMQ